MISAMVDPAPGSQSTNCIDTGIECDTTTASIKSHHATEKRAPHEYEAMERPVIHVGLSQSSTNDLRPSRQEEKWDCRHVRGAGDAPA
jgi:hypothetical protein